MSQQPKPEQIPEGEAPPEVEAEAVEGEAPAEEEKPAEQPKDEMSPEQKQAYDKMMATLDKMNTKIEKAKLKLNGDNLSTQKTKTDEITNKLIESKQNSEIITKQNLLTDITENYEKVVIGVYSENGKLKKKIEEMAKIIKEQNGKIYEHARKEEELMRESEQLRAEILKMKDDRLMNARGGHAHHGESDRQQQMINSKKKQTTSPQNASQNQDFDFWSMPQNNSYDKKKKDFVQDSNLWVNQKETESPFITDSHNSSLKRKK